MSSEHFHQSHPYLNLGALYFKHVSCLKPFVPVCFLDLHNDDELFGSVFHVHGLQSTDSMPSGDKPQTLLWIHLYLNLHMEYLNAFHHVKI